MGIQTIRIKNTNVVGKVPQPGDIDIAELCVNLRDHTLFSKDADGNIFELTGGVGIGVLPPAGEGVGDLHWDGDILLVWDGSQWQPVAPVTSVNGEIGDVVLALGDLSDVTTIGANDGDILVLQAGTWVPVDPATVSVDVDLDYTASPTGGLVTNTAGTDSSLPLVNSTNAGLMAPGDFDKLAGLPDDIPEPGDGTLTIQENDGSILGTFTANQSTSSTITLPEFFSGHWDDLEGKPCIPECCEFEISIREVYQGDEGGDKVVDINNEDFPDSLVVGSVIGMPKNTNGPWYDATVTSIADMGTHKSLQIDPWETSLDCFGCGSAFIKFNACDEDDVVNKIIAGDNVTISPTTGIGDVTINAADPGVTKIVAGTNVTISPTGGTGEVTINATASGGGGGGITSATVPLRVDGTDMKLDYAKGLHLVSDKLEAELGKGLKFDGNKIVTDYEGDEILPFNPKAGKVEGGDDVERWNGSGQDNPGSKKSFEMDCPADANRMITITTWRWGFRPNENEDYGPGGGWALIHCKPELTMKCDRRNAYCETSPNDRQTISLNARGTLSFNGGHGRDKQNWQWLTYLTRVDEWKIDAKDEKLRFEFGAKNVEHNKVAFMFNGGCRVAIFPFKHS